VIVAATHTGYIAAAWGTSLVLLAGYSVRTVLRGRALSRRVPPEDRRWS
jgi:hypothetical protein